MEAAEADRAVARTAAAMVSLRNDLMAVSWA